MNIFEFVTLNNEDKAKKIWNGTFVALRYEHNLKILLYRLDGFWVEVFYDKDTCCIKEFRPFVSRKPLNEFLVNINIDQAFINSKFVIKFPFQQKDVCLN